MSRWVLGFVLIVGCQFTGGILAQYSPIAIPGPILGMGLLFVLLMILDDAESLVEPSAHWLLKHLPLFFIPGGAGLVLLGDHIKQDAPAIITAIIVSTLLSVLVTAWLYAKLTQRTTNTNHVTNDQS